MSGRVLGVIIAVAILIGICKLIWAGLNWLQVFTMRRRVIRRRLGLSPWRFRRGRWWIFGPPSQPVPTDRDLKSYGIVADTLARLPLKVYRRPRARDDGAAEGC